MSIGRKDDQGKLRWRLLRHSMTPALESVLRVLEYGAKKYGEENWKQVEDAPRRYRDALDRHLAEIDKGVDVDPETGESHLAHVATNALFLLQLHQQKQAGIPKRPEGWLVNTGDEYIHKGNTRVVEVILRDGTHMKNQARAFSWRTPPDSTGPWEIQYWRYV